MQMPPGVPVATVAIDGAKNAALLAIQILAVSDDKLTQALKNYKQKMGEDILGKNKKLQSLGSDKYLEQSK